MPCHQIQGAAEQIKQFGGVNTWAVVGVGWCTCSVGDPISVANMVGTGTHRGFAMRMYFENSSNKAHFHLSGAVNKQNFRYWAKNNPRIIHERLLHSPTLTVWCAVSQLGVIGPYVFEEEGVTVTVNSERYVAMLRNFLQPRMEETVEEKELGDVWFQQDGAAAHTPRNSMNVLGEIFPGRLVSLRGDVGWPARSPDLSI
jgi:hypothetical protein